MRVAATVLTMAALLVWARVGPGAFAAGLFILLAVLGVESRTEWARALDASADAWVDPHRTRELTHHAARLWDHLGEPAYVAFFAVAVGALLSWRARSAIRGVVLVGAIGIGVVIEYAIKGILVSFPSGHVMGITTLLGLIAVLLAERRGLVAKAALAGATAAGVVFVAGLAVYSGAHSVTDVFGGAVLGAAMVSLGVAVVNGVESRKRPARPVRVGPHRDVRRRVPAA